MIVTAFRRFFPVALVLVTFAAAAEAPLFESDSKRFGSPKMDIVVAEVERRPRISVLDIRIAGG